MIGDRGGVTPAEMRRAYPCDEWVRDPALQAWRAVTVEASADNVWPWIAQIRLAPYSYDWIDNLGRTSPRELVGLDEPAAQESFTTAVGFLRAGRILSVDPGRQLTGRIAGVVITYLLEPGSAHQTRLLMKLVSSRWRVVAPALCVGDLVMARRQLLNIKRLAERAPASVASVTSRTP
jgi:hypothetical protein